MVDTKELIIDFYEKGNSRKKTCKEFKISDGKLKKLLIENNIKIRSRSEQLIIENMSRTKRVNHLYFSILNENVCYYIGFFAADATVRKRRNEIKIGLSSVDKKFLESLRVDLDIESKVKTRESSKGFKYSELTFSSYQIKLDLSKYGVVPNKTYIGVSMRKIPKKYQLHYIKGFFDGDGCFSFNKSTKQCKLSFTSYRREILDEINSFFNNAGYIYSGSNKSFSLEFSTLPSIKIMNTFYGESTPYLGRKRKKYEEFLKLRNNNPRDRSSLREG